MKVYIKENKLPLIKESNEEITFYGFFTQVKNFMKELLNGNITAEPSDILKAHGLGRKELIKKLIKRGLLKSDENITEVPNGEENGKKRASYTIKYSVPRQNFETKFHRLYTELYENKWKENKNVMNESIKDKMPKFYFPTNNNSYFSGFLKLYENNSHVLLEGLLKSYPIDFVVKDLTKHMSFTNDYNDFLNNIDKEKYNGFVTILDGDNKEKYIEIICYNNKNNDSQIRQIMNLCGYNVTDCGLYKGIEEIRSYSCEQQHTNKINELVKEKKYIYHITKANHLEKILKYGLEPRANKKKGEHLECIFFLLDEPNDLLMKKIAYDLFREKRTEYALLTVSTENLNADFFYDVNTYQGVYTRENIAPQNIVRYKVFNLDSEPIMKNESKSVLSNEKEEIKKILDNDIDNSYHERGGYKITENLNNQDAPLYHYTSIDNFFHIIKTGLRPSYNDGTICVSFARCKELNLGSSFHKEVDVRMKLNQQILKIPRYCKIKPFQADNYEDEFEERVYTKNNEDFLITNVKEALISVDILITKGWGNEKTWRCAIEACENLFGDEINKVHFFINEEDFIYDRVKESYDNITAKQYLNDFLELPHRDTSKPNHLNNYFRAKIIDAEEEQKEKELQKVKDGKKIASLQLVCENAHPFRGVDESKQLSQEKLVKKVHF